MEETTKQEMIEKVRELAKERWKKLSAIERWKQRKAISEGMRRYWDSLTPAERAKRGKRKAAKKGVK